MDQDIRSGLWVKPTGFTLGEATLGVIGVGNIGRAIVRRAVAFGMRTLGNDLVQAPEPATPYWIATKSVEHI